MSVTRSFPATSVAGKKPQKADGEPVWRLNVAGLGYVPWGVREGVAHGPSIGQICFTSDDRLVVAFVSHTVPKPLPHRGQADASSSMQIDSLFVDTKTGQLQTKREWPTTSGMSRISPATRGKFVVITPDKLVLYSPALEPVRELGLPIGADGTTGYWGAEPSPAGKYLLVWYDPRGSDDRLVELVDTETLQVVRPWTHNWLGSPFDGGNFFEIDRTGIPVIGPPGGPSVPFRPPWDAGCRPSSYFPVNDQTIFGSTMVSIDRWCYSLATTDRQLVFSERFGEKEIVRSLSVSAGGRRFALAVYRGKGGSWAFDIPARYSLNRIMVYDIPSRKWVYTLDGKKQGIKSISGLALSPDGSLLALIDQEGILEVYRLPPADPANATAGPP